MNSLTRESRRDQIVAFFCRNIGKSYRSDYLHSEFGSAFRSRCSELNRDLSSPVIIHNHVERSPDGQELSSYWAAWRHPRQPAVAWVPTPAQGSLFGDTSLAQEYPD